MTRDIRQIAQANNIATEYSDARGETVRIADDVLSDLLAAVGASTAPDASEQSEPLLPPVVVVKATGEAVKIAASTLSVGSDVAWRVVLEDGDSTEGRCKVTQGGELALGNLPLGYHQLTLPELHAATALIVTPGECWLPDEWLRGDRSYGLSLQLYLLRSRPNFGIGDFGDLSRFAATAARHRCDVIGVNPLHQMFLDAPEMASPYSPVSRYFLNVLYIDLEALPEWSSPEVQAVVSRPDFARELAACRSANLVDYAGVTRLKLAVLRAAYGVFVSTTDPARHAELRAFVDAAGPRLRSSSLFQALRSSLAADGTGRTWPDIYGDASSTAVKQFAEQHADEIAFLNWTQWLADLHLAKAAEACAADGMRIGIYRDLAVGCDRAGAETWSEPKSFLDGVSVGAPPDILNPAGQNWGLPPFNPVTLREQAYRPFRDLVAANMRHAGGLRIDHVMGLKRLYCIPDGRPATEGAYIEYPLGDMLGIIALESQRSRCIVVGEDLGTVPPGFREQLSAANILSYRVVMFEQNEAGFIPPQDYPAKALAVAGSHDMATLTGWHAGSDIDLKEQLGLYPSAEEVTRQRQDREREKQLLEKALSEHLSGTAAGEFGTAVHRFLGDTRAMLAVAQLDDLIEEVEPVNVPGTVDHHNWRRKYAVPLESLNDHPGWRHLSAWSQIRGTRST